ncbi:hypothetical protein HAX54_031695, partial [Datura stramonium]|nr:hypothetical protein [Datura stramonium]
TIVSLSLHCPSTPPTTPHHCPPVHSSHSPSQAAVSLLTFPSPFSPSNPATVGRKTYCPSRPKAAAPSISLHSLVFLPPTDRRSHKTKTLTPIHCKQTTNSPENPARRSSQNRSPTRPPEYKWEKTNNVIASL